MAARKKTTKKRAAPLIYVTGAAGFIGSAVAAALNGIGNAELILVDELGNSGKWKNLLHLRYLDYLHKDDFRAKLRAGKLAKADAVIHMGACSSTTEMDMDFLMDNNLRYSQELAAWAVSKGSRFIYASSAATYGDGEQGYSDEESESAKLTPLNPYGYSKQLFDLWLLRNRLHRRCVGLKFFNVFGPNEYHKGEMRSMVLKAYEQISKGGTVRLFKSYRTGIADGEQQRDFIYIKDCVDVILWLLAHRNISGIMNLGTGVARSWNDLILAVFSAMEREPRIEYVEMPESIRNQYQYFTQAPMAKLHSAGYRRPFRSLEEGVRDYVVNYLRETKHLSGAAEHWDANAFTSF